ncbi:MAG: hypothetical protein WBV59_20045 [Anaerolineae bacterium]
MNLVTMFARLTVNGSGYQVEGPAGLRGGCTLAPQRLSPCTPSFDAATLEKLRGE